MAYYKPCKNCAVDKSECPTRSRVAAGISGLHVTAINFRCDDRQPMFRLGQRVTFSWRVFCDDSDFGTDDESLVVFAGTVLEEHGLKFIVRVDDGPARSGDELLDAKDVFKSGRLIIKVKPSDMSALNEPDQVMCGACCAYDDEPTRCQGWGNPNSWDSYWPKECIHQSVKLATAV